MCKTRFQVRKQETREMCIFCMWLDISMIILYLIYLFSLLPGSLAPGMPQVLYLEHISSLKPTRRLQQTDGR